MIGNKPCLPLPSSLHHVQHFNLIAVECERWPTMFRALCTQSGMYHMFRAIVCNFRDLYLFNAFKYYLFKSLNNNKFKQQMMSTFSCNIHVRELMVWQIASDNGIGLKVDSNSRKTEFHKHSTIFHKLNNAKIKQQSTHP